MRSEAFSLSFSEVENITAEDGSCRLATDIGVKDEKCSVLSQARVNQDGSTGKGGLEDMLRFCISSNIFKAL